ncbi:MAG: nucleotidyltransferase domain-containing protein [Candidatus Sericytochromatia bacterium]|nr:nucleotidyltransferase domain-containing protein [Candidatus Tanganyikabacteria bacterium]
MKPSLDALTGRIRARWPDVVAIFRFGTAGTDQERPDSDLDLAVLPAAPIDPGELWAAAEELASLARKDVDLVDLLAASMVLRARIVATGDVLYCADEAACGAFAAHAMSDYTYLNLERKGILEDIQKRGRILG